MALERKTKQTASQSTRLLWMAIAAIGIPLSYTASAQTIVIGGVNRPAVTVNMNPVYGNFQHVYQPLSSGTDFSKSAKIIDGDEVFTLTPPGSKPKKKRVAAKASKPRKVAAIAKKPVATQKTVPPSKKKIAVKAPKTVETPKIVKAPPKATPKIAQKIAMKPTPVAPSKVVEKTAQKIIEKKIVVKADTPTPIIPKSSPKPVVDEEIKVAAVAPQQMAKPVAPQKSIPMIEPEVATGLQQLFFEKDETKLPPSAKQILNKLAKTITSSNDRIQLVAYADASSNGTARRLSLGRALVIRSKLMELGVPNNKIEVRALGKPTDNSPADRVDLKLVAR